MALAVSVRFRFNERPIARFVEPPLEPTRREPDQAASRILDADAAVLVDVDLLGVAASSLSLRIASVYFVLDPGHCQQKPQVSHRHRQPFWKPDDDAIFAGSEHTVLNTDLKMWLSVMSLRLDNGTSVVDVSSRIRQDRSLLSVKCIVSLMSDPYRCIVSLILKTLKASHFRKMK